TGGEGSAPPKSCVYRRAAYRVIMVPNGRNRAQSGPRTVGEGGRADAGPAAVAAHCPPVDLHDGSVARAVRQAGGGGGGDEGGAAATGEAEDGEAGAGGGAAGAGGGTTPLRRGR